MGGGCQASGVSTFKLQLLPKIEELRSRAEMQGGERRGAGWLRGEAATGLSCLSCLLLRAAEGPCEE